LTALIYSAISYRFLSLGRFTNAFIYITFCTALYYEGPGLGKEPLFFVQGKDAVEVVSIAVEIGRRYKDVTLKI